MDAFPLVYAVGSLIAASLVAAVVYLWLPARKLMGRDRFEKIFGFPPPKGKKGPGSQPIPWDRTKKVHSYLREDAFRTDQILHNMYADLEALTDNEENPYAAVKVGKLFCNLAAQLFVSYRAFYLHWRRFNRVHSLAMRFGFTFRALDYAFYVQASKLERERGFYCPTNDRLLHNTKVRTTKDAGAKDWSDHARRNLRWGTRGVVIDRSDAYGLYYRVRHEDGSKAWYESAELEKL